MSYEVYSLTDANYLIKFYGDKVKGQLIDSSLKGIISYLEKELSTDGKYRVIAISPYRISDRLKSDISGIAKGLNLLSPDEVLKLRDQSQ